MELLIIVVVFIASLFAVGLAFDLLASYRETYRMSLSTTARELNKIFVTVKPSKIVTIAVVLGGLLGYISGNWIIGALLGVSGIFAPKVALTVWKSIRSKKFDEQLMDALILLGNALKSGLDIVAGIELVSTNMTPPISEEFGLVLNAYRLGAPVETALIDLTGRIRSRTLETVVYAINIQREAGGNLVKTFDQLIATIREENKLQKKVKALTSQGRTQIYFLAGFPWLIGFAFYTMAPDMMSPAMVHPYAPFVICFLLLWEIVGILITKKIVTVDV